LKNLLDIINLMELDNSEIKKLTKKDWENYQILISYFIDKYKLLWGYKSKIIKNLY
jgi:hypothetical protein